MPARQVRDVLDWIRNLHRQFADQFQSLAEHTDDQQRRGLFEDIGRRESRIESSVSDYERNAPPSVLNTWLQFGSEDELPELLSSGDLDASLPMVEIIGRAMAIDDLLLELYRELRGSTSIPHLDELFASLVALEESKQHHYARLVSEITMGS